MNAEVARTSGEPPTAASVSLFVSLALVLPLPPVLATGGGRFGRVAKAPGWASFGGLAGVGFVAGGSSARRPDGRAAAPQPRGHTMRIAGTATARTRSSSGRPMRQ